MSGAPTIESNGIELKAKLNPDFATVVSPDALEFVAKLHRAFEPRRQELLKKRVELAKKLDAGQKLDFLPETKSIREGDWKIAPVPKALETRRVELTGPVDAKMVINALNSGADSYMADFEDSNSPYWENIVQGHVNLKKAVRRDIALNLFGKEYKLNEKTATLIVRPRGWHLDEKHVLVDLSLIHISEPTR
ncbi:MAG: malate synthase A, partial [Burkholderiaceae bacterium]|nr:malate synthase A [Burkholderiaceae bacterium]